MSDSFVYLSLHKSSFARVKNEKGKREKILTIATGYPGVQTFPTPFPPRLFISEREVGVGKVRKKDEGKVN